MLPAPRQPRTTARPTSPTSAAVVTSGRAAASRTSAPGARTSRGRVPPRRRDRLDRPVRRATLLPLVPRLTAEWAAHEPSTPWRHLDGIDGVRRHLRLQPALRAARRLGPAGTEELTDLINACFESIIGAARGPRRRRAEDRRRRRARAGSTAPATRPGPRRAASTCTPRSPGPLATSTGRAGRLRMSVGRHTGTFTFLMTVRPPPRARRLRRRGERRAALREGGRPRPDRRQPGTGRAPARAHGSGARRDRRAPAAPDRRPPPRDRAPAAGRRPPDLAAYVPAAQRELARDRRARRAPPVRDQLPVDRRHRRRRSPTAGPGRAATGRLAA